jgi:Cu+-exporting ATPase
VPLRIEGMHCAACVTRVEKVLKRVPGVAEAQVNFATGQAQVTGAVARELLIAAVERAGYGARVSRAALDREADEREASALRRKGWRAAFAGVVALPAVAMMVPGIVPGAWHHPVEWALLLACLPVMAWSGREFYVGAAKGLPRGQFDINTLIATGTGAAWVQGALVLGGVLGGMAYLDSIPVVTAMVLLGQWIEGRARRSTRGAIRALLELAPGEATLERDGVESTVPLAAVRPGDVVVVRANARVPVDGEVVAGESAVDQSMLTGEPVPVPVGPGARVTGGTVNGAGVLRVRARAIGEDAALARIVRLVEQAQAARPPIGDLVDRVAAVFVPIVMSVALLAGIGWSFVDPLRGVEAALAVLVVACPCAMGLATPLSLVLGLGNAARAGVLLRSGPALQALGEIDTVVFDKTGTLTVGRPVLARFDGPERILRLGAAADRHSNHPLAAALVREAGDELPEATEVRVVPGAGVEALVEGHRVRVGSPRWLGGVALDGPTGADGAPGDGTTANPDGAGTPVVREVEGAGPPVVGEVDGAGTPVVIEVDGAGTPVVIEVDGARAGVAWVRDVARPGAARAVARLRGLGLRVVLLSGDARAEAQRIGRELGIAEVRGELLPADKIAAVEALRREGRRVAMVGDGVNDAPALAAADLGIAMGSGTDVAIEAAGATLQRLDPGAVADGVEVARATLRNVKQNLLAAFGYNTLAIPLAAAGLLHPAIAGAAMALSSVTVVSNARRLARPLPRRELEPREPLARPAGSG